MATVTGKGVKAPGGRSTRARNQQRTRSGSHGAIGAGLAARTAARRNQPDGSVELRTALRAALVVALAVAVIVPAESLTLPGLLAPPSTLLLLAATVTLGPLMWLARRDPDRKLRERLLLGLAPATGWDIVEDQVHWYLVSGQKGGKNPRRGGLRRVADDRPVPARRHVSIRSEHARRPRIGTTRRRLWSWLFLDRLPGPRTVREITLRRIPVGVEMHQDAWREELQSRVRGLTGEPRWHAHWDHADQDMVTLSFIPPGGVVTAAEDREPVPSPDDEPEPAVDPEEAVPGEDTHGGVEVITDLLSPAREPHDKPAPEEEPARTDTPSARPSTQAAQAAHTTPPRTPPPAHSPARRRARQITPQPAPGPRTIPTPPRAVDGRILEVNNAVTDWAETSPHVVRTTAPDGTPVYWLAVRHELIPHVRTHGETASGKSNRLNWAARERHRVHTSPDRETACYQILADLKGGGAGTFLRWSGFDGITVPATAEQGGDAVAEALRTMRQRYATQAQELGAVAAARATDPDGPIPARTDWRTVRTVILLDELNALARRGDAADTVDGLAQTLDQGREVEMFVHMSTHTGHVKVGSYEVIPGSVKDQMRVEQLGCPTAPNVITANLGTGGARLADRLRGRPVGTMGVRLPDGTWVLVEVPLMRDPLRGGPTKPADPSLLVGGRPARQRPVRSDEQDRPARTGDPNLDGTDAPPPPARTNGEHPHAHDPDEL